MFINRLVNSRRRSPIRKARAQARALAVRRLRPEREELEQRLAPAVGAWSAPGALAPALISNLSSSSTVSMEDQYALSAAVGREDPSYAMAAGGDGQALDNAANGYRAVVDAGGLRVESGADVWSLSVLGVGHGEDRAALGQAREVVDGNRVEYDYGGVSQWFVNGPMGLQQGFTLAARPEGSDGPLTVDLAMGGTLIATADAGGRSVTLARADGSSALGYGGLIAYDAMGRETPATMSVRSTADGDVLSIQVDDADAVYPLVIDPHVFQASIGDPNSTWGYESFGSAVAISGDGNRAVVGASGNWSGSSQPGAVYVFDRVGTRWSATARLTVPDAPDGWLGFSVAITWDGTIIAASAPGQYGGIVYVFADAGGYWTQADRLVTYDGVNGDFLGQSVAISGDGGVIVAGAPYAAVGGSPSEGAAYVFTRTGGQSWDQTAKLILPSRDDYSYLGWDAAISAGGNTIALGLGSGEGALIFDRVGSSWSQTSWLAAYDEANQPRLIFKPSLSANGNTLLVGAPYPDPGALDQGAAYVFERAGAGAAWYQTAKLTASRNVADSSFGASAFLSADGTTALVGTNGARAAYSFIKSGANWTRGTEFFGPNGVSDYFGYGVAVNADGSTLLIGAGFNGTIGTTDPGMVHVYYNSSVIKVGLNPTSRTATAGVPTTFTAASTGAPAFTQWQVETSPNFWADIPGETNPWFTIVPTMVDSGRRVRAVFTTLGGQWVATAPAQLNVTRAGVILNVASDLNPRRLGDPLTFIVDAVAATPGGAVPNGGLVRVNVGGVNYYETLRNGRAIISIPPLPLGTFPVTASYDGTNDPIFGSATATMTQVVVRGTTTMTGDVPMYATAGQPVTLKAILSFAGTGVVPSGGVVINDGGQPIRFEQIRYEWGQWVASFTTSSLAPGDHYIRFIYLGEAMAEPARTDQIFHLVIYGGVGYGNGVGDGAPSAAGGEGQDAPGSSGSGAGSGSDSPAGGLIQPEAAAPPNSQTVTAGTTVTFTAAPIDPANNVAQWQVSLGDGSWFNILGATSWWHTFTPSLAESGRLFRAVFSGGVSPESTPPAQLLVVKAGVTMKITSNVNPRRLGDPLVLTVNATPTVAGAGVLAGGVIRVNVGGVVYLQAAQNGRATFSIPSMPLGTYPITATYDDTFDPVFGPATAIMTEVVTRGTTMMTGVVPTYAIAGQPVTLSAVLAFAGTGAVPAGGVMINDGGQPIRFEQIRYEWGQWVASFTTSSLAPGDHYIRFVYLGESMAEPARTDQIFHLVVYGGGGSGIGNSAGGGAGAGGGGAFFAPSTESVSGADMAGVAAAMAIAEATRPLKTTSAAAKAGNGAAAPAAALPNALTALRFQRWRVGAG